MDKERLFQFMRVRFHEAGFTSGEIDIHIARFADRYASMSDEEIENDLRAHGGTAKIVSHVIEYRNSTLMKDSDYRAFVEGVKNAPETEETKAAEPEESAPMSPAASQEPQPEEPAAVSSPSDAAEADDGDDEDDVKTYIPGQAARAAENTAVPAAAAEQPQHRNQPPVHEERRERGEEKPSRSRGRVGRLAEKTYWGEASAEGFRRFWILFAVCLPFVIILGLAFLALSAAVIAVLVVGIVVLVFALVGEVAVGAALALVGIIYGISQLFITLPIGLFETGIGVTIIGATIFVGILLYNLAVRFLPFLLRQYIRFMKFLRAHMKDVYYYLKGECYRR